MDTLIYRLPNEKLVHEQKGSFVECNLHDALDGFVVTDFLHQRLFQFKPSDHVGEQKWHVSKEEPTVISPRDYLIESQGMLNSFSIMGIEKAVYSRVKAVSFSMHKVRLLFDELEARYPNAFCYLISSDQFGTWIGATPELLLQQEGMVVETVALAGTHRADEEKDWSQKEMEEHYFVSDAVASTLQSNGCVEIERSGPKAHLAGPVQHLKTDFKALLTKPNAWAIATDLHPTPAVCGTPRMQALDLLVSREMHQRELYTGMIGFVHANSTHLFVNLRCAQLQAEKAFLYVGGGYTKDSIPDLEWEETENKAKTLMDAIRSIS